MFIDRKYFDEFTKLDGELDDDTFRAIASRASDFVNMKTYFRINNLSDFPEDIQEKIKKAVAMYTEMFFYQGCQDAYNGFSETIVANTVQMGRVRFSGGANEGARTGLTTTGGIVNNPIADQLLISTGLCYRGTV
ncbi:MAG: hypothetical protein GX196_04610 [Clostridiaceae bacterium]|nr:hypothetical protein [Clostridiaceae bacterium]